jgi:hypothetical protein
MQHFSGFALQVDDEFGTHVVILKWHMEEASAKCLPARANAGISGALMEKHGLISKELFKPLN